MSYDWKTDFPGVFSIHADDCPVRDGGDERCGPLGYRASVRDWTTNKRLVGPMFGSLQDAVAWQRDQLASPMGGRDARERTEVGALVDEYIHAAEDGSLRNGGNEPYTREHVRALRGALSYVDSELGTMAVQDVRRRHVQAMIDQLRESGLVDDRVGDVVEALRSLYTYAIRRELVGFSPVVELDQPAVETPTTNGATPPPPPRPPGATGWTTGDIPAVPPPPPPPGATGWTTGDIPAVPPPVSQPWTPPPWSVSPQTEGAYGAPWTPPQTPPPQPPPPYGWQPTAHMPPPLQEPGPVYPPYAQQPAQQTGPLSGIIGAPAVADANYDATMQERWLWWTVRIVVIVFVLIALVLVAESV